MCLKRARDEKKSKKESADVLIAKVKTYNRNEGRCIGELTECVLVTTMNFFQRLPDVFSSHTFSVQLSLFKDSWFRYPLPEQLQEFLNQERLQSGSHFSRSVHLFTMHVWLPPSFHALSLSSGTSLVSFHPLQAPLRDWSTSVCCFFTAHGNGC